MFVSGIRSPAEGLSGVGQGSASRKCGNSGFSDALRQAMEQEQAGHPVEFSKHAAARAEERGIEMTPALMDKLTDSVERAQAKGARNILAIDQSLAFIINVPNNRVVTLMRQDEMKENVFTNIDGAVLL